MVKHWEEISIFYTFFYKHKTGKRVLLMKIEKEKESNSNSLMLI